MRLYSHYSDRSAHDERVFIRILIIALIPSNYGVAFFPVEAYRLLIGLPDIKDRIITMISPPEFESVNKQRLPYPFRPEFRRNSQVGNDQDIPEPVQHDVTGNQT